MDGAALLLLVSGVGVAFGWQPMPDGTPRYEYVVQIEPELAATLADGKSIPIVSEIPPDVQPVGRIRVVVGREAPPRQRLVTLLKPATAASEADSSKIQLAQYDNPYAGQRYAAAPAQEAPPQTSWNNQQPDPPITPTGEAPPSTQQLFGQSNGTAWNSGAAADSVAGAATDALSRVGNEIQRSVDPIVRNGVERVDAEVRAAADSLGDRTRNLVDGIRQPLRPQQPGASQPAPAASAATSQAERSWNDPPAGNPLREHADAGATWNGSAAVTQGSSGQLGAAPAPATPTSATPALTAPPFAAGQTGASQQQPGAYDWNSTGSANSPVATAPGTTGQPKLDDPWANAPDPRGYPAVADSQSGARPDAAAATRPLPFGGLGTDASTMGPRFPGMGIPITGQQPGVGAPTATAQPGVGATVGQPPAAVGSRLLNQPADRPLDDVASPAPMTPAPGTTTASAPTTPPWSAVAQRPGATAVTTPTTPAPNTPLPAANPQAAQAAASNAAAVLVAWVLLSGSIAGNFYLFWSYLDVRHKYRAVVRKTARAVGSRFSAA